jgi:hypothetical protein
MSIYERHDDATFLKMVGTRPTLIERELVERLTKAVEYKAAMVEAIDRYQSDQEEIAMLKEQLEHMQSALQHYTK